MVSWLKNRRTSPIGLDLDEGSIKMVQFSADRTRVVDAVRWDLRPSESATKEAEGSSAVASGLREAREGRKFRGREVILCLDARDLLVQNVRVPKTPATPLDRLVHQEAARRVPYAIAESEIRFLDVADVRQGEVAFREVILLACHRPVLEKKLEQIVQAGLRPIAVDVQPLAILRCYAKQFRRDEDQRQRAMFLHVGTSNSIVVIAQGTDVLFVKYLDVGGRQMDDAVARHLHLSEEDAAALRRHNGDRRADQQDPEVARGIAASVRPIYDQLASELSLCIRYHSVTFRGQPLVRLVIGGAEAGNPLIEAMASRLDLRCELGEPLRNFEAAPQTSGKAQWDIAAGLALRDVN
jgi:type IV pilus assembly protein PilM